MSEWIMPEDLHEICKVLFPHTTSYGLTLEEIVLMRKLRDAGLLLTPAKRDEFLCLIGIAKAERDAMQKRVRELEAAIRIGSEEIHKDDGDYALGMKTLIEAIGGKYPAADYKTEPTTIADIIAQHKKGPQRGRRG